MARTPSVYPTVGAAPSQPDRNRGIPFRELRCFPAGFSDQLAYFYSKGVLRAVLTKDWAKRVAISAAIASMRSTQGRHVKESVAGGGRQIYSQPCQTFGPSSSRWRPGASDVPLWMVTFGLCPSYGRVRPGRLFLSRVQGGSFLQPASSAQCYMTTL